MQNTGKKTIEKREICKPVLNISFNARWPTILGAGLHSHGQGLDLVFTLILGSWQQF
jgi:hypothetical protein